VERGPARPSTLRETVALFLGLIKARGYAGNSLDAYTLELERFEAYAKATLGFAPRLMDLSRELLAGFVQTRSRQTTREGQPIRATTLARTVHVLRSFVLEVERRNMLDRAQAVGVYDALPIVHLPDPLPRAIPQALLNDGLDRLGRDTKPEDALGLRRLALVEFLYGSGARAAEVTTLTVARLDMTQGMARLMGKGSKERIVPVGRKALQALRRYWKAAKRNPQEWEPIFLSKRGTLTIRGVERDVHAVLSQIGTTVPTHPHALRHSYATHLLNNGAGIREIQGLLGHEKVQTTTHYARVAKSQLQSVYAVAHPRG
jgi:site-specific recombinase XerD